MKNLILYIRKSNRFSFLLFSRFIYGKLRDKLIQDGFIYQCKYCWGLDVSGHYGRRNKK